MRHHRRTSSRFVGVLVVFFAAASCGGGGDGSSPIVPVTGIALNQTDWSTGKWECENVVHQALNCWRLVATVLPADATNKKVRWESDPSVTLSGGVPMGPLLPPDDTAYVIAPRLVLDGKVVTVRVTTEDGRFTATCTGRM